MKETSAEGFRSTKTYDVLIATPLILFYSFSLAGLGPQFAAALRLKPLWVSALQLLSLASFTFYLALIITLIFLRRLPVAKFETLWPRALALLASNTVIALALLPHVGMPPLLAAISTLLMAGGTTAELVILSWLGRSFSVLPEARRLVTDGPYHRIRHPLYLASFVGSLGAMLQFKQPWALLMVLSAFALQIWRMQFEEQVLARAFPDYARYMARTSRLIPEIY